MDAREKMKVTLVSFGFKHGLPESMNYLWDVRCLPNPHWEDELRPHTGLDHDVSEYVIGSSEGRGFLKLLKPMVFFIVQQNQAAGKKAITLAVGCTGGRHRSVSIAEVLRDILAMLPVELELVHRDIDRES